MGSCDSSCRMKKRKGSSNRITTFVPVLYKKAIVAGIKKRQDN